MGQRAGSKSGDWPQGCLEIACSDCMNAIMPLGHPTAGRRKKPKHPVNGIDLCIYSQTGVSSDTRWIRVMVFASLVRLSVANW